MLPNLYKFKWRLDQSGSGTLHVADTLLATTNRTPCGWIQIRYRTELLGRYDTPSNAKRAIREKFIKEKTLCTGLSVTIQETNS